VPWITAIAQDKMPKETHCQKDYQIVSGKDYSIGLKANLWGVNQKTEAKDWHKLSSLTSLFQDNSQDKNIS